ncbi:MAG: exosome complex protein Rrp42 [Nanoarchaeota archaeon]|nr:exosome complex protein Rrp42 [Nanoarchaeota archaeon]
MVNESKKYIRALLQKGLREDNRKLDEYRNIEIEYGVSAKSAEGSARVKIGGTEVVAGIKMEVGKPFPDKPDEGTIMVNVELLPLSSPDFESGPPNVNAIELSRVVDRGIRESKTIDFKKLCIKSGEKVWLIFIDIYPINNEGNLFDAAALAAFAALKDAKFPVYDEKTEKVKYDEKTEKHIPLENLPMACTVLKIDDKLIIDPSIEEENAADARITAVSMEDGNICAMQKGGDKPLNPEDLIKMVELSIAKAKEFRKAFK